MFLLSKYLVAIIKMLSFFKNKVKFNKILITIQKIYNTNILKIKLKNGYIFDIHFFNSLITI
ncbi:hypothetical protein C4N20_08930 [Fusobacterium ulcerans]|nr:hypothetical protein C4N20_08930 [Fusobacterium ulcerans]